MVTAEYVSQLSAAGSRYAGRAEERTETARKLDSRGVLHTDEPSRVTRRLERLGADWSLAAAMERTPPLASTGASLDGAVAPEHFGAGVLGLERLMGRNDLIDVGFLEAGWLASRSVGRVVVRGRGAHYGTGFLVSPSLLLTNNHVLRDQEEAGRGVVEFNFQTGADGTAPDPVAFCLEPSRFFATDRDLDFTVVAVAARSTEGKPLSAFGMLPLDEAQGKAILGEMVNIVQHPNGEPKQLALRENRVMDLLETFVHYETDTAPGSSGSPVFNDQWEVVALHHSAVPLTDGDGHYLALDGTRWTPETGEQNLAWKANEGVRVSRVVQALRDLPLTGVPDALRAELLEAATTRLPAGAPFPAAPPFPSAASSAPAWTPAETRTAGEPQTETAAETAGGAGTPGPVPSGTPGVTTGWTVPLRLDLTVVPGTAPAAGPAAVPPAAAPAAAGAPPVPGPEHPHPVRAAGRAPAAAGLGAALVDLEAGTSRPYYDRAADEIARETYYAAVRESMSGASPAELRSLLAELLESSHLRRPAYQPMRLVYPWVDLHPDRRLRSLYSGKSFDPVEFIRADAAAEAARAARWQEFLLRESAPGPGALAAESAALEAALPYNCEHVVPQSWFGRREPMRGDLHHLFACETGCNSFRGNFPYADFPDFGEALRHDCGRREQERGFEPSAGKGAAARATLYFLLRYPGYVGDAARELTPGRLELLLAWHEADPAGEWELHRNAAIGEIQGNRNPLIDHPGWARAVDYSAAWA
ncbi:endonuclease [Streptomyces sp. S07_1.15]|uniref:endonuclease n=1 Tax=Streptomyces sp. S07_1.15 TaxID=2873925 RepID=UPI001D142BB1|nr:endonuclease [Streptomyces sp. S07_1.15]MCC3649925.1 endonuclease [Streptomyces sp. S07_1.15]